MKVVVDDLCTKLVRSHYYDVRAHHFFHDKGPVSGRFLVYKEYEDMLAFYNPLMPIYEHEMSLDKGRFEFFKSDKHEYSVSVPFSPRGPDRLSAFEQKVGWIAAHATSPWNVEIMYVMGADPIDDSWFSMFSFADRATAVLFKLFFGGLG